MNWFESLDINFKVDDIFSSTAEAIICPVKVNLSEYGKISQAIYLKANDSFLSDLSKVKKRLKDEKLALGQAITIDSKASYQVRNFKKLILVALWDDESEYSYNLFYTSYINSIREAIKHNVKTIALPIMAYDGNLNLCCQAITNVLRDLNSLKKSEKFSVDTIDFISLNNMDVNFAENYVLSKLYR